MNSVPEYAQSTLLGDTATSVTGHLLGWAGRPSRKSSEFLLTTGGWLIPLCVCGGGMLCRRDGAWSTSLSCLIQRDPSVHHQESGLRKTKDGEEQAPPACEPSWGLAPDPLFLLPLCHGTEAGTPGYGAVPMCYIYKTFLSTRH